MADVSTAEFEWTDAPEVPLTDLEMDDDLAALWRHALPRSVVLLSLDEGEVLIAAAECPDDALIEKIANATGVPELNLVRVSQQTLEHLHERLRGR
ncbi:MAG: hypothetical protein IRZ16_17655 [Myxococcaceae bacterium]|nr:hypothetical protein [Myxococcaceae bacterium]